MRFAYHRDDALPRLAWCCRVERGAECAEVRHGPWLELRGDRFFEGAWDGDLAADDPTAAVSLAGTAGSARGGALVFASASHPFDRLYAVARDDVLWVSNSWVFALVAADDEPDPRCANYAERAGELTRSGLHAPPFTLPTRRGEARVVVSGNLVVQEDGAQRYEDKPVPPAPAGYEDYVAGLSRSIGRVFANAADPRRRQRYRPLALLSRGYDANAVAALARQRGCAEACTLVGPDWRGGATDDDGRPVGAALALAVTTRDRFAYAERGDAPEAEFCVHPYGSDVVLASLAEQLAGRLLLPGRPGDALWGTEGPLFGPQLERLRGVGTGGASAGELRLRTGTLLFPPAYIGWQHAATIQRISSSEALAPWSVGGDYDRPIARRILEAAGVPRALFGQSPYKGGAHVLRRPADLSPSGRADYTAFCRSLPLWQRMRPRWLARCARLLEHAAPLLQPAWPELGARLAAWRQQQVPREPAGSFLVHWGFARTRGRYARREGDAG